MRAVAAFLGKGQTTVGTAIRIEHRRATPVGGSVEITATPPRAVAGSRLTFRVQAVDGRHRRVVVVGNRPGGKHLHCRVSSKATSVVRAIRAAKTRTHCLCGWGLGRSHRVGMGAVVKTVHGEVRGRVADGGYAFLGVPYAAAPFGVNRLLPPQPVQRWDGVRDASSPGPEPPQVGSSTARDRAERRGTPRDFG